MVLEIQNSIVPITNKAYRLLSNMGEISENTELLEGIVTFKCQKIQFTPML
ncbi:MAG: hypothetical protein H7A23_00455 [Leptospiraceae bacterium]|nr:hypothetical protein [Leptospiraceae bacterium]MCP5493001.1 hypothetical protein [Leptospiraceae bacterium]